MLKHHWPIALRSLVVSAAVLILSLTTQAQTFKILHAFTNGTDGGGVYGGVVMDKQGNLYGATSGGGAYGNGAVFELSPNTDGTWTETVLYSFTNGDPAGAYPTGTLIFDAAGNLYGTTPLGGANKQGTVFEMTPVSSGWSATLLYAFGGYTGDAARPNGRLIRDGAGNLYGTSATGGANQTTGSVFALSPGATGWTETVLYSFPATGAGGGFPLTGLIQDATGDLYGTTYFGGNLACGAGNGCGVAYKLRPSSGGWKENVVHDFGGFPRDGTFPLSPLSIDSQGNLYGTTKVGGIGLCVTGGCGVLFKLTPTTKGAPWKESIVYQFRSGARGSNPLGALLFDQAGVIYGADGAGGTGVGCECGVIYSLTPSANNQWTYKALHSFAGTDGALPYGDLIIDGKGNLYGSTVTSGPGGAGVVFEITP